MIYDWGRGRDTSLLPDPGMFRNIVLEWAPRAVPVNHGITVHCMCMRVVDLHLILYNRLVSNEIFVWELEIHTQ